MKIWEIEAQSLRIMFADSDLNFSEAEFNNGTIQANPNTRDKLVRMVDSIRRGIDLYYSIVGEQTTRIEGKTLLNAVVSGSTIYYDILDFTQSPSNFGFPTRVDVKITDTTDPTNPVILSQVNQIDYIFDAQAKRIYFSQSFSHYYNEYDNYAIEFVVWYKVNKANIPANPNEMTYDLDALYIPSEVQRALPFYVKSELYEEDEFNISQLARQQYIAMVSSIRKPFNKVQTKVKSAKVFSK